MQLSSLRVDWAPSRTWFVTARLLEVAASVALLGAGWLSWQTYQSTSQMFAPNGEPTQGPPFLDRVAQFAVYSLGYGQAPIGGIIACLLLIAIVAVLHFAQPVGHASLLRWEVFAVWAVAVLLHLLVVAAIVVGLVRGDPSSAEDGSVTFNTGPGFTEVVLAGSAVPVLSLLLLSVSALWWLRLPVEFDAPADEPERSVREPRRWRPAPAQDANVDDLTLDGVELIEPVERLQPRGGGDDGSSSSGYDDYFRRF
jgi:hypothetical protein